MLSTDPVHLEELSPAEFPRELIFGNVDNPHFARKTGPSGAHCQDNVSVDIPLRDTY